MGTQGCVGFSAGFKLGGGLVHLEGLSAAFRARLSFEEGAAFIVAFTTAFHCLVERAGGLDQGFKDVGYSSSFRSPFYPQSDPNTMAIGQARLYNFLELHDSRT